MKDKVKPIFGELKGMLIQAPKDSPGSLNNSEQPIWKRFNSLAADLNTITGDAGYLAFQITPHDYRGDLTVPIRVYRASISGLIARLHATFFSDEQDPFGNPSSVTTISQNQNVSVQVYVELGMQLQSALEKAETPAEKSFIEGLKEKVSTVKSFIDFGLLMTSLADQYGITPDRVKALFGFS